MNTRQRQTLKKKEKKALRKMIAEMPSKVELLKNQYGVFAEVVRNYLDLPAPTPSASQSETREIAAKLCLHGRLATSWGDKPIPWHRGLETLCKPETEGALGRAAADHADLMIALYRRWSDLQGSLDTPQMYRTTRRVTEWELKEAALVPHLPIPKREYLTDVYISTFLKPYAQAIYFCRQAFWDRIKEGHVAGAWLCFRPLGNGNYQLMLAGTGFDGQGSYTINRATYLAGFSYSEDEHGMENHWNSPPYPDQDNWMFVATDDAIAAPPKVSQPSRGRPVGTGIKDDGFVKAGVQLLKDGAVSNASAAAKALVEKYNNQIEGTSFEGKCGRLRRKIKKAWDHEKSVGN